MIPPAELQPWVGRTYRHVPDIPNVDPLDFSWAGVAPDNRWNDSGVPAIYLTPTEGTAVAEWARHLQTSPLGPARRRERALFTLEWALDQVVDLRSATVLAALAVTGPSPAWVLDKDACRRAARAVRSVPTVQAFLVPSMAFLDDLTHWNLIVYADRIEGAITGWRRVGSFAFRNGRVQLRKPSLARRMAEAVSARLGM